MYRNNTIFCDTENGHAATCRTERAPIMLNWLISCMQQGDMHYDVGHIGNSDNGEDKTNRHLRMGNQLNVSGCAEYGGFPSQGFRDQHGATREFVIL